MNQIEYSRMYEAEESHWWYVGLHQLILATIRRESQRLGRPLIIFDAGCGTGRLCQLLTACGHTVSGCDASDEALQFCRIRGITSVYKADLNTLELEAETFDVITSIDVLYHTGIDDDVAVLRQLRSGLKPGGMLILNLVAHEFLRSTHDIAVHTRERYNKKSLWGRLQKAGLNIELLSYRVSFLFPFITIYRLLVKHFHWNQLEGLAVDSDVSLQNPYINFLFLKTIEVENVLLSSISMPIGSSIFAVARRPMACNPYLL